MSIGLYLHVPYCRQACSYCDFYFTTLPATRPHFAQWVGVELDLWSNQLNNNTLHSIYLGGGTPSLLEATTLQAIFSAIHRHFALLPTAEVTLEANADDITPERLALWRSLGINRLSVGVQSFQPSVLQWMKRAHTAQQALAALPLVQEYYDNYTVDLIFAVPGQVAAGQDRLASDVAQLLSFTPPHISIYGLTAEPQTLLHHWISKGQVALDEDQYAHEFAWLHDTLTHAGYAHYEVSNYARAGYQAVHNSAYWQGHDYLGIGPSAHSYLGGTRYANVPNLHKWADALQLGQLAAQPEPLDADAQYTEYLMTRLRTAEGLPVQGVAAYAQWGQAQQQLVQRYVQRGWLQATPTHWRPTVQGWLLLDTMIAELL